LHIGEGATHIAMYDTPGYMQQALAQLVPLYHKCRQEFFDGSSRVQGLSDA
jgi:hypothetical protein